MAQRIEQTCTNCGKKFRPFQWKVERYKRLRKDMCCSMSCARRLLWRKRPDIFQNFLEGTCKRDEFSPFRRFLTRILNGSSNYGKHFNDSNLTLEYLKALWDKQNGICPYTGHKMELKPTSSSSCRLSKSPFQASLDRIDSSKGYVEGNVEFVCLTVNYAKNRFTQQQTLDFFRPVRNVSVTE